MFIKITTVGDYSKEIKVTAKRDGKKHKKGEVYTKRINPSGKVGGTLRRGWTAETQEQAESGKVPSAKEYANSLKVLRMGNNFIIIVKNPVEYSSYVEFGHRQEPGRFVPAIGKRLKAAWVAGQFMLTISEKELESQLPKIIERKMTNFIEECFNNGY